MKFPGRRKNKHYFPVDERGRISFEPGEKLNDRVYVVGIDQLLVDIEAHADEELLKEFSLESGESVVLSDDMIERLGQRLSEKGAIIGTYAGGSIGNTLHNYSVLSDDYSIALGCISAEIKPFDHAFHYICNTNSHVDFTHLRPVKGPMGRAYCLIDESGERTFAIGKGIMNDLDEEFIKEDVIKGASALLISTFLLRDNESSLFKATLKAVKIANKHNVPVVLALGTSVLVRDKKDFLQDFIKNHVQILAMNVKEGEALNGMSDPLLSIENLLESVDLCLFTVGEKGLYIGGYCDQKYLRETGDMIHTKSIPEYNRYEYSRAMRKQDCENPVKVYTHLNPYLGGPELITNTNGAGDAALSALLHDLASNDYHKKHIPLSPKHEGHFMTYSSVHQVAKYCNRVSYEVLKQNSPRLSKGLPQKEDVLEESYWER